MNVCGGQTGGSEALITSPDLAYGQTSLITFLDVEQRGIGPVSSRKANAGSDRAGECLWWLRGPKEEGEEGEEGSGVICVVRPAPFFHFVWRSLFSNFRVLQSVGSVAARGAFPEPLGQRHST